MHANLTLKQVEFLEKNIFKISSERHLTSHAEVAFIKYKDLITVIEEIFNDGNFKIEQVISIDATGIPRLVEFEGYVLDEGKAVHRALLAQFVTYQEKQEVVFENDFIKMVRTDRVFFDKPLESSYETISKPVSNIGDSPLYAKLNPQPVN